MMNMASRTNTTIEQLPMNWSIVEAGTGDEAENARYSRLWIAMFCEWVDYHYGWANLALCGDELIGSIDYANHPGLPDSLYESFEDWIGGEAFAKMDAYSTMPGGVELSELFGPSLDSE